MTSPPVISVVIPVCDRRDDLVALHRAYEDGLSAYNVEYNYVVDGGAGEALNQLQGLLPERNNVKVFHLARRFGEATALRVGFEQAMGDILLTLPAFSQIEPEELPRVIQALDDSDMVICRRYPRVDTRFNRLQTRLFHWAVGRATGNQFSDLACSVRAITRELADDLPVYGDQNRFLPVLAIRLGYEVKELELAQSPEDSPKRAYGLGVYMRRTLDLLNMLFLIKFTQKPLRFFGLIGSGAAAFGGIIITVLVIQRMFFATALGNRPLLFLASLLVILGVQLLALGLIGELLIFIHARDLKEYRVKEIVSDSETAKSQGP